MLEDHSDPWAWKVFVDCHYWGQGDEYQTMYDQPEREKVGGDFEEEE